MQIASILFLFLFLHHVESSGDMNLFKVNSGHCMDGTPAAYYFRPSNNSTKWMLSLQGGGACYTKDECTSRSKGDLGSSKNYKSTYTGNRWFSADATSNPDFYDFNTVYVPYCSSDVHSGQQTNVSALTWGFYFSGHLNLGEIVKDIQTKHSNNWNKMTKMLITGGSAGGVGTFFNADWLVSLLINIFIYYYYHLFVSYSFFLFSIFRLHKSQPMPLSKPLPLVDGFLLEIIRIK